MDRQSVQMLFKLSLCVAGVIGGAIMLGIDLGSAFDGFVSETMRRIL